MKTKEHGFSLIEMMVVMALVAMLSAGGVYGWQKWQQQQRLGIATQQIRNLLEQLRSDANWHNRDHLLRVNRSAGGWCLSSKQIDVNTCKPGGRWQLVQPFADVDITEITPGLGFYGVRNTAWPGHITVQSPTGKWRIILSAQGRIRVCEVTGSNKCS
ncbi:prepilin peptidase-dependent protein [Buttiauxella gaviniae]|uniref:Prepilin peptidase-dependent protein n=1 Tax=Buttiauxella gaviniae TaxID=82990 RepID=A0ABV3NRI5_9ENTR